MSKSDKPVPVSIKEHGPLGFLAFVAWVGAVVYFVQESAGFWGFVLAVLKACVWPAFAVYHVLQMLHA